MRCNDIVILVVIAKHLRFGHQEDAHEFLRYVIDGMQKSCLAADGYTEKWVYKKILNKV